MYVNINNLCCLSFHIGHTSLAYEKFVPTPTHQVEKESVSVASTSASIMPSMITTIPTSNTNLASGALSSLHY